MTVLSSLGHYLLWGCGVIRFQKGGPCIRCVRRSRTGVFYVKWCGEVVTLDESREVLWMTPPLKRNEEVFR